MISHRLGMVVLAAAFPALAQEKKIIELPDDALTRAFEDRRDLTLLRKVTDRTYVHEAARVSFTVPPEWKEIRPHRLARRIDQRIHTILGVERSDRDLVASLYWIQMNPGQKLADWVRDTPIGGEYGEEYETLRAVYGKDRVTTPVKIKHGPFDVYRIQISGGPDRGDRYDGTLYIFAVESGGQTWLVKARVSHPKLTPGANDQYAAEVLHGYAEVPPGDRAAFPPLSPEMEKLYELIVPIRGLLPRK